MNTNDFDIMIPLVPCGEELIGVVEYGGGATVRQIQFNLPFLTAGRGLRIGSNEWEQFDHGHVALSCQGSEDMVTTPCLLSRSKYGPKMRANAVCLPVKLVSFDADGTGEGVFSPISWAQPSLFAVVVRFCPFPTINMLCVMDEIDYANTIDVDAEQAANAHPGKSVEPGIVIASAPADEGVNPIYMILRGLFGPGTANGPPGFYGTKH